MKLRGFTKWLSVLALAASAAGCASIMKVSLVDAGKKASAEDTGFLSTYTQLETPKETDPQGMPDLSYISPKARMKSYSTVIVTDFTSLTDNVKNIGGMQAREYKTIKQELPDQLANALDGAVFRKATRTAERFDPKDIAAIQKLPADAVLMGNIKELVTTGGGTRGGLTAIQVEYKLVDVKTGEEVVTAIHRATTDVDKVAMPQVRVLGTLLSRAKELDKGIISNTPAPTTTPKKTKK